MCERKGMPNFFVGRLHIVKMDEDALEEGREEWLLRRKSKVGSDFQRNTPKLSETCKPIKLLSIALSKKCY